MPTAASLRNSAPIAAVSSAFKPCRRLIEQQAPRPDSERAGDFDQPLVDMRRAHPAGRPAHPL